MARLQQLVARELLKEAFAADRAHDGDKIGRLHLVI
jgi:hypothetical protein